MASPSPVKKCEHNHLFHPLCDDLKRDKFKFALNALAFAATLVALTALTIVTLGIAPVAIYVIYKACFSKKAPATQDNSSKIVDKVDVPSLKNSGRSAQSNDQSNSSAAPLNNNQNNSSDLSDNNSSSIPPKADPKVDQKPLAQPHQPQHKSVPEHLKKMEETINRNFEKDGTYYYNYQNVDGYKQCDAIKAQKNLNELISADIIDSWIQHRGTWFTVIKKSPTSAKTFEEKVAIIKNDRSLHMECACTRDNLLNFNRELENFENNAKALKTDITLNAFEKGLIDALKKEHENYYFSKFMTRPYLQSSKNTCSKLQPDNIPYGTKMQDVINKFQGKIFLEAKYLGSNGYLHIRFDNEQEALPPADF